MDKQKKYEPTVLNKYDRKMLEKYTGYYTNFIESNTAETDILKDQAYQSKK